MRSTESVCWKMGISAELYAPPETHIVGTIYDAHFEFSGASVQHKH